MSRPSKTLVVAATRFELAVHPRFPQDQACEPGPWELWDAGTEVFLACGPGPALAGAGLAWALGLCAFDRVLGLGIAGAYDASGIGRGEARWVAWESFGDLGAQDGERWLDFPALSLPGLPDENRFALVLPEGATGVEATTISAVTGNEATASERRARLGADLESMEGAAWALVCRRFGVPLLQARGVSNRVGLRDRPSWRIREALEGLGRLLAVTPGI